MNEPRLMVSNWIGGVAVEWKCSCDSWSMELPPGPIKPQEKATMVRTCYADHVNAAHSFTPLLKLTRVLVKGDRDIGTR